MINWTTQNEDISLNYLIKNSLKIVLNNTTFGVYTAIAAAAAFQVQVTYSDKLSFCTVGGTFSEYHIKITVSIAIFTGTSGESKDFHNDTS